MAATAQHRGDTGGSPLRVRHLPPRVRSAVLTLHGGQEESRARPRHWHPAALRMRPVLRSAASAVSPEEVLLGEVRYRHRGWNEGDPAQDALAALDELTGAHGAVPVVLIGHSMGGRAALTASRHPQVRGVLALAPWVVEDEPVDQLRGRRLVVVHGDRDRVTSPAASVAYVRRARARGACAGAVLVRGGDHAMLRRAGFWHRSAAEITADLLRDEDLVPPARAPEDGRTAGLAARSLTSPDAVIV
ncbi:serine aminopeptidase domain-containing protein [Streptomyces sp. NPDC059631]|uniref:serine aminopeptidase domain-containing protein n=1 Tax=unclassified Streptomyces TaxID=2593676 RepID=UPI0036BE52E2